MGKSKVILGLAVLALAGLAGWQIISCEVANLALQEDLQDLAAQGGAHIGLLSPSSEEDLRNAVIQKAKRYEILLEPSQITVQRKGSAEFAVVYLAADYKAPVHLLGFSFEMHFTPASKSL